MLSNDHNDYYCGTLDCDLTSWFSAQLLRNLSPKIATAGVGSLEGFGAGDLGIFLPVFTLPLTLCSNRAHYREEVLQHDGSMQFEANFRDWDSSGDCCCAR